MADPNTPERTEHTVVLLVTPGDVLGERWRIESRIGQGAMGSVFRGTDLKLERPVAIKLLAPEHCRKPKVLARFEREANLMTTLRHPNIIQLFGVGRRGALPFIVMQYLEGMTLGDVTKMRGGKLTPAETLFVVKQVAAGLSFVHHNGLVHRDIKPQNVFMSPGGRLTILDLGVVRDKSNPGLTKPGAMVGTPYYMSPEQIQGVEEVDKRTDVYALAAMTFELLTGRPPYLGANNFEVLYAHRNTPVPDASTLSPAITKQVAKVLMVGLAKRREERPESTSEFYADLEAHIGPTEKVDPALAFPFLEVVREAPRKRPLSKGSEPSQAKKPPPPAPAPRTTSGEVPFALSGEVRLMTPSSADLPVASATHAEEPSDTMSGDDDAPVQAPADTGANTEELHTREVALRQSSAGPTRETVAVPSAPRPPSARETREEEQASGPDASEPGATLGETGELRVVTTVKGLTSTANLFIDGQPHGTAPRSVVVPAGAHTVRVERAGHRPTERAVQVTPNQVTLIRFELIAGRPA